MPHSPLDSHTSPGNAASQFHATSRLVGDGHLSGGTSRRQMPQDNPASQVPHAGGEGGGAVASLKARAFAMRQEVMRRVAVGDIPGRGGRRRRRCLQPASAVATTAPRLQANFNVLTFDRTLGKFATGTPRRYMATREGVGSYARPVGEVSDDDGCDPTGPSSTLTDRADSTVCNMLVPPHIEPAPERTEPTPAWIAARLWQLRYVKDAHASTRTLRVTEAPDAAFARKKLAELSAKSHSDAKPAAARAATAAATATDAAPPSEEDMLARRLLARVLRRSLAATWLEESELDRDPVLPQGREATALRVALHEKTERVRAQQGALELRERELAASECDNEGACLFSSLLCREYSNRGPSSPGLRESDEGLSAATGDDPSAGGRLRPDEAWDTMARSRAARAAAERVLQAVA